MPKKGSVLNVVIPANAKPILALDAKRHKRSMGRRLVECWIKELSPEDQAILKGKIGIALTPRGDGLEVPDNPRVCKKCGSEHANIPGDGPWHDPGCEHWIRRAMWG